MTEANTENRNARTEAAQEPETRHLFRLLHTIASSASRPKFKIRFDRRPRRKRKTGTQELKLTNCPGQGTSRHLCMLLLRRPKRVILYNGFYKRTSGSRPPRGHTRNWSISSFSVCPKQHQQQQQRILEPDHPTTRVTGPPDQEFHMPSPPSFPPLPIPLPSLSSPLSLSPLLFLSLLFLAP